MIISTSTSLYLILYSFSIVINFLLSLGLHILLQILSNLAETYIIILVSWFFIYFEFLFIFVSNRSEITR